MLRIILGLLFAILFSAVAAAEPVQVRIMSFNIWYGGDQVSFDGIIEAIKKADADIVGLQEPDGSTLKIAALAGYPYADVRRHIISRYPLFDSGAGERTEQTNPPYSIAGVDSNTVHAWVRWRRERWSLLPTPILPATPTGLSWCGTARQWKRSCRMKRIRGCLRHRPWPMA